MMTTFYKTTEVIDGRVQTVALALTDDARWAFHGLPVVVRLDPRWPPKAGFAHGDTLPGGRTAGEVVRMFLDAANDEAPGGLWENRDDARDLARRFMAGADA
jgi:hypothetical protein